MKKDLISKKKKERRKIFESEADREAKKSKILYIKKQG